MARRLPISLALASVLWLAACAGRPSPHTVPSQMDFGVEMARQGLWSEAYFRFKEAAALDGNDAQVFNNLAVSEEALGRFDAALKDYKRALALAPADRNVKANYDRFASFYESFRSRREKGVTATGAKGEDTQKKKPGADEPSGDADDKGDAAPVPDAPQGGPHGDLAP